MRLECFTQQPDERASDWVERVVSIKGLPFRFEPLAPFYREVMDAATNDAKNCRIIVKCPAQTGKSLLLQNVLGWYATHDVCPTLFLADSLKTSHKMATQSIRPFLQDQLKLKAMVSTNREDSKSATLMNLARGVPLVIGTAKSGSDTRSFSARLLILDEVDAWPQDTLNGNGQSDGDPVQLAFKRSQAFPTNSMAVLCSTPTREEAPITRYYRQGTCETWCAFCHCGHGMPIHFKDIDFSDPQKPTVTCPECGEVYTEEQVIDLQHGYSQPGNADPYTDRFGRICRSFEVFAGTCHAQFSWRQLYKDYKTTEALGENALRAFVNTTLSELYVPKAQIRIPASTLKQLGTNYDLDSVPPTVTTCFAGVDVMDTEFVVVVIGVSDDAKTTAILEHKIILGDLRDDRVWADLRAYLNDFRCTTVDGRTLGITLAASDYGGHFQSAQIALALNSPRFKLVRGKGVDKNGKSAPIMSVAQVKARHLGTGVGELPIFEVGRVALFDWVFERLTAKAVGGALGNEIIWPMNEFLGFTVDFFSQLTANQRTISSSGITRYECIQGEVDHAGDALIYSLAASEIYRLSNGMLPSLTISAKAKDEAQEPSADAPPEAQPQEMESESKPKKKAKKKDFKPWLKPL